MSAPDTFGIVMDALVILSKAKNAAIGEAYDRVELHTRERLNAAREGRVPDAKPLDLHEVMSAYSAADGAWNRLTAEL